MNIQMLVGLQRAFDQSRGMANLPEHEDAVASDQLSRLEYSLIGLTGEVGEIANIIKKARRGRALAETNERAMLMGLGAEIADVMSYLLKLADQAHVDPGRAWLLKMCRNAHRFSRGERVPLLTIAGPPGSGKSTIVRAVETAFAGNECYLERFEENPWLDSLDSPADAFDAGRSQRWFLDTMTQFIKDARSASLLLDQDPTAIVLVYGQLLFDRGMISSDTFDEHLATLLRLEIDQAPKLAGRTVILLDAPAETLAKRCARKAGPRLEADFLEDVRARFARVFAELPNIVRVDASRPVSDVVRDVRTQIDAFVA
ncbi:MAG: hypothetical protein EON59_13995 [Alphaproteobacteria bacterium]|nr:MAG: hypothetical protein EON59_13995 [Alphaproteobacteria bacterium]